MQPTPALSLSSGTSVPDMIDMLPFEVLMSIFSLLSTPALLPLTSVCRTFHGVALRILRHRLSRAAALPQHQLILECYHPSAKISTPYLYCDYLGTDGLDGEDAIDSGQLRSLGLGDLAGLYSRFRPVMQEENRRPRLRYPVAAALGSPLELGINWGAGGGGGGGGGGGPVFPSASSSAAEPPASQQVYLDETELFSQLCAVTNLVKCGPKRGLFLSHVNIAEGVIRVWRQWLVARAAEAGRAAAAAAVPSGRGQGEEERNEAILWADVDRKVGLRFRVVERVDTRRPVLARPDEDLPVSYTLEYEELLVRTSQLLLMVEKSDAQEVQTTGKAIVIAAM